MHITHELEAELNAEQTHDENKDGFSSFSAMLKARYGAGETCNYEEAYQAWKLATQANQVETAVDKVLDGIDATKVREQLQDVIYRSVESITGNGSLELADILIQNFIIMPRS